MVFDVEKIITMQMVDQLEVAEFGEFVGMHADGLLVDELGE